MVLAEGPICCVGTLGLLVVILGLVLAIAGSGAPEERYPEQEDWYGEDEDAFDPEYELK
jgi:hypothetical protein